MRGRRDREDPEERIEPDLLAPRQYDDPTRAIDVRVYNVVGVEVLRQRAQQRQNARVAPVAGKAVLQDIDLQHVARRGAADVDRASHEVRTRTLRYLFERRKVTRIDPGGFFV